MSARPLPLLMWLLSAVVIGAGLADLPRIIQLGSFSGLAALAMLECAAVWCCWLNFPWAPRDVGLLALVLFVLYATGSLLWTPISPPEIQNLVTLYLTLGLILLTVREVRRDPNLPARLLPAFDALCALATLACVIRLLMGPTDEEGLAGTRGVVIVMLVGICYQLAAWQCGQPRRSLIAGIMTVLIILTLSRMASAVAVVLFPLAIIFGAGRRGNPVRAVQMLLLGGGLVACLFLYEPIHSRFLGGSSISDIREEGIDTTGRLEMWEEIFASWKQHPWLGQGVGATRVYTDRPGMYHPHNDYLLLAHDYGILGLTLFVGGLASCLWRLARHLRKAGRSSTPDNALSLASALSIATLMMMMATDNSVSYAFVMAPTAVLLGVAIASLTGSHTPGRPYRPQRPPITQEPSCNTSS